MLSIHKNAILIVLILGMTLLDIFRCFKRIDYSTRVSAPGFGIQVMGKSERSDLMKITTSSNGFKYCDIKVVVKVGEKNRQAKA